MYRHLSQAHSFSEEECKVCSGLLKHSITTAISVFLSLLCLGILKMPLEFFLKVRTIVSNIFLTLPLLIKRCLEEKSLSPWF